MERSLPWDAMWIKWRIINNAWYARQITNDEYVFAALDLKNDRIIGGVH